ncbi:glycosyltransferase family 9 protein [Mucilaginibacter aquatilis]|uniref:Glycosyltransferase family 9 protein n=1 Tax=Mucilaginibacter aquatilis TaxID=1517760 RepID=A0A6I4IR86_9SPHI|nr:glycosyltransferase family 9 protein [Mucilaginibacter aquatilis]MVN93053.1 glycosyltransferase family 9 protein [Mucilaginibacter aquatilis]
MKWQNCKKILVIRPDNMGDLIMSGPAIRALKETFNAHITVLTSGMAKNIIAHMPEIDDSIIFDLPWVKTADTPQPEMLNEVVATIKQGNFDAAVIFTVLSQNPLPTAMLAYLAGIPQVLAYCRENPYQLINCWVPDKEPYDGIKHQVQRDLDLVAHVGAYTNNNVLSLLSDHNFSDLTQKLQAYNIELQKPWVILHAGVSELKRQYPLHEWALVGKELVELGYQVLLTGASSEKAMTDDLQESIGAGSFSVAGLLPLNEFICLVEHSPLLISVNTGTIHIAAAFKTPTIVLYAQTNPQHTPWNTPAAILEFSVPQHLKSKNEVIRFLDRKLYSQPVPLPSPAQILDAARQLLPKQVEKASL